MRYEPQVDPLHVLGNASGHGSQGAKRAVDLAGHVAGAGPRAGARRRRGRAQQQQHHGQRPAGRARGHRARGPWAPAWARAQEGAR